MDGGVTMAQNNKLYREFGYYKIKTCQIDRIYNKPVTLDDNNYELEHNDLHIIKADQSARFRVLSYEENYRHQQIIKKHFKDPELLKAYKEGFISKTLEMDIGIYDAKLDGSDTPNYGLCLMKNNCIEKVIYKFKHNNDMNLNTVKDLLTIMYNLNTVVYEV